MYSQLSTSITSKEEPPTFVTVRGSFTHEHNKTAAINNNFFILPVFAEFVEIKRGQVKPRLSTACTSPAARVLLRYSSGLIKSHSASRAKVKSEELQFATAR